MEIQKGDIFNLVVTFSPTNATNKNITWSTSDEKIATVSATGIITAIAEGRVTIIATTEDGNKTASCVIDVKAKTNTADDIYKDDSQDETGFIESNHEIITNDKDITTANKQIPYTGERIVIFVVIFLGITVSIVLFIRYRSFKDVK